MGCACVVYVNLEEGLAYCVYVFVSLFQHLQTSKGSQNMDYFVIGAANYVEYNTDHKHDVPKGSSKFVWADISEFGGFAYFEATSKNMTFKFIDGERKELYEHVLFPRK